MRNFNAALPVILAVALAACWTGCASDSATVEGTAAAETEAEADTEAEAEDEAEDAINPLQITDEERNRKNPIPSTPESIASGQRLFSAACEPCHGPEGQGRGVLSGEMELEAPALAELQGERTDGEIFFTLTLGHEDMPGQDDRLPEQVRWDLVNYIRTLEKLE